MTDPVVDGLVEQSTLDARVEAGDAPDWVAAHWRTFDAGLTDEYDGEPFPCYFGANSVRAGEPLYTAVPSTTDPDALFQLGETLLDYLDRYEDLPERASLVAFFKPHEDDLSEAEYHETLWNVLQFLHVHDPEPWPEEIPTDPDDKHWEFCFGGEAMFPTCRAPFYDERRSRYSPSASKSRSSPGGCSNASASPPTRRRASTPARRSRSASRTTTACRPTPTSATGASTATASGHSTCSRPTPSSRPTSRRSG
ncbi:hypothetical protein SY89_02976 [Halolamina pelagica]|uniref:YqcI/YcgG family protein n=1 Tax=Halolamina pelagica TaxID=699431 RepID=A0A0P7GS40_9EURY|nr:hypothetical protein SY89_02976 [Halolamina pelagica]